MAKKKKSARKPEPTAARKIKMPSEEKLFARDFVLRVIDGEDGLDRIIRKVYMQALKGSFKHQELLLNYILGKPTEKVKLEAAGIAPAYSAPVVKIIADHLRLEKLNKDVEAAVSEDRIKEMEDILNKEVDGR